MTVAEVKKKLEELSSQKNLSEVEFVCDNQKYFLSTVTKGPQEFSIAVTRKNHRTLDLKDFIHILNSGNAQANCTILNSDKGGEAKAIENFYLSSSAIEIAGA